MAGENDGRTLDEKIADAAWKYANEVRDGYDPGARLVPVSTLHEVVRRAYYQGAVDRAWMPETEPEAKSEDTKAEDALADGLSKWWLSAAKDEVEPLIAKMIEYGGMSRATDLEEIGRGLVHSGVKPWERAHVDRALETRQYQEMGIYFYLLGKFARWTAAVAEGRPVSDDTLLDIGIYVRMAQRVRAVGGWPV